MIRVSNMYANSPPLTTDEVKVVKCSFLLPLIPKGVTVGVIDGCYLMTFRSNDLLEGDINYLAIDLP